MPQYHGKCKLDGTKLVIKGKSYDKTNLNKLPNDVNPSTISSKESTDVFGFFGELNPLSNFHPCKFVYNNIEYHSSEQLIQYQKARQFGDIDSATAILSASKALECKCLSKNIANYNHDQWKDVARIRFEEGIMAKFMQNSDLCNYLLNIGSKRIVECCGDKLWSNGLPLHDFNCLTPCNWSTQGLLGVILEHIRTSIKDILGTNKQSSPPPVPLNDPAMVTENNQIKRYIEFQTISNVSCQV